MRQTQLRNKSRTPHRQRQCSARHMFPKHFDFFFKQGIFFSKPFEKICAEYNYATRARGTKDPEGSADIDKIVF